MNVALGVAKEELNDDIYTLSTDIRIRLKSTPTILIQKAMNKVKDPPVPTQDIDGVERENPIHPAYIAALEEAQVERGLARIDTILLWGVELVDDIPDDGWLEKLQFMERQDNIDLLSSFDLDNPLDREFVYKKYVAIGSQLNEDGANIDVLFILNGKNVISEDGVEQATSLFPGDTEQDTITNGESKEL